MSNVPIQDAASATRKIDTFQRTAGPDIVETQAVAIVDPTTGNALVPTAGGRMPVEAASLPLPTGAATQATLATLLTAAQAIQAAAEALNGKTTAVNTGAVTVANFPGTQPVSGPLTDTQLRAAAVPVSAAALPLPSGAATAAAQGTGNTSLASIDGKLPALSGGAVPVTLGGAQAVTGPLTDTQLRAAAVPTALSPTTASGTITVQNSVPNGVATAGSAVEIVLNGAPSLGIQTTGTYTGALSLQVTLDGTRWETVTGAIIANALSGVAAATIASAAVGVFTAPVHGALRARVTGLAAVTGTASVTLRTIAAPTLAYVVQPTAGNLNVTASGTVTANIGTGSVAAGTNAIGDVGIQYRANATGAGSFVSVMSPLTPAAATIKGTAGRVLGWQLQNSSAGLRSVKVFGVATPTLGTTAALFEIDIPAGGRSEIQLPGGLAFGTAATYSVTSAKGLTDNTATGLAVADVSGAFFFA